MALAIAITLGLLLLAVYILYKLAPNNRSIRNKFRGEIRLARSISRTIAESKSTEWHEYQDWLHDILLARRQLLDAKHPQWKVSAITYWRLSVFCIVVGMSKLKQVTASIRKSR